MACIDQDTEFRILIKMIEDGTERDVLATTTPAKMQMHPAILAEISEIAMLEYEGATFFDNAFPYRTPPRDTDEYFEAFTLAAREAGLTVEESDSLLHDLRNHHRDCYRNIHTGQWMTMLDPWCEEELSPGFDTRQTLPHWIATHRSIVVPVTA